MRTYGAVSTTVSTSMKIATAAAVPKSPLADAEPVDVGAEQVGVAGDAAGLLQHVDLGEHPQVPDHLQQPTTSSTGRIAGSDDVPEPLPGAGAVDLGGLDQVARAPG